MAHRKTICVMTDAAIHGLRVTVRRSGIEVDTRSCVPHPVPESLHSSTDHEGLARAIRDATANCSDDLAFGVTLVVPLTWCYTHVIEEPAGRHDEAALCYELEPYLPVPLESITAVFSRLAGHRTLAVAVSTAAMLALLDALTVEGVTVESVNVDLLGVVLGGNTRQVIKSVAIADENWLRVALGADTPLVASIPFTDQERVEDILQHEWNIRGREGPFPEDLEVIRVCGIDTVEETNGDADDGSYTAAVDRIGCAAVANGAAINLRQGALASTSAWESVYRVSGHCMIAAILLLIVVATGTYREMRALHESVARLESQRDAVYRRVFDVETIPPGAAMRLASERVRLAGLTRRHGDQGPAGNTLTIKPLDVLRDVVAGIPEDLRLMLLEWAWTAR